MFLVHEVWQCYQDNQKIGYFAERNYFHVGLPSDFEKILSRNGCFVERNDGLVIGEEDIGSVPGQRQTEFSSVVPCCKRTNCMENAKRWQCGPYPGWSCKRPKLESSKKKEHKKGKHLMMNLKQKWKKSKELDQKIYILVSIF